MSKQAEHLEPDEVKMVLAKTKELYGEKSFEYRTIQVLLWTGMHVSVLCDSKSNLHVEEDKLVWNRPKKKGRAALTVFPMPKALKPWIEDYLAGPRWKSRFTYRDLCIVIREATGIQQLSPMSFRHTCAINMLERGFAPHEVQQLLNVSAKTLNQHYAKMNVKGLQRRMDEVDW